MLARHTRENAHTNANELFDENATARNVPLLVPGLLVKRTRLNM